MEWNNTLSPLCDNVTNLNNVSVELSHEKPTGINGTIIIAIQVVASAATLYGNTLILLAIVRTKKLQTILHYWMASLAVADFLVGLTIATKLVLNYAHLLNELACRISIGIIIQCSCVSIFSLVGLSIDSFKCIRDMRPASAATSRDKLMVKIRIAVSWIVWSSFAIGGALVRGSPARFSKLHSG